MPVRAERLKNVADLRGVRPNQLIGYGLVVGLAGTGDDAQAGFGPQGIRSMLKRLGARVDQQSLKLPNVAAVVVTAELPAFVAPGQRLDVTVSSIASAKSLEGGTLLATPLKGADMKVYSVAQGAVSVGGFLAAGGTGSRVQKNHPTVGRIPSGAIVERAVPMTLRGEEIEISLRNPDFTTAVRLAESIQRALGNKAMVASAPDDRQNPDKKGKARKHKNDALSKSNKSSETTTEEYKPVAEKKETPLFAYARDAGSVIVRVPPSFLGRLPALMAKLESVEVQPDIPTRVVINERTGTVVLGEGVLLAPVAIAHGGLTVEVSEVLIPSQPGPLSNGETVVVPNSQVSAQESGGQLRQVTQGASLGDVVRAINALGVSPRDLVAILQTLKSAGALRAELIIE